MALANFSYFNLEFNAGNTHLARVSSEADRLTEQIHTASKFKGKINYHLLLNVIRVSLSSLLKVPILLGFHILNCFMGKYLISKEQLLLMETNSLVMNCN